MEKPLQKYFLAANSCHGFFSAFRENYSVTDSWRVTLIKGGPGTGKSSFMRHLAAHGQDLGEETVLVVCSSDPQSLDGVIFPRLKRLVVDATAPHTLDPQCVGLCENILDLGAFWSESKLQEHRADILLEAEQNKLLHQTAARYIAAAGNLMEDSRRIVTKATDPNKISHFARRLIREHLPPKRGGIGREWVRFIEGITPNGVLSYPTTVTEHFEKIVVVSDTHGTVCAPLMNQLKNAALQNGYEVITLKSPFFPQETDHLLIPQCSLAFVRESAYLTFDTRVRRIHDRRFVHAAKLHDFRGRLTANRRLSRELLREACSFLSLAKKSHDRLEQYYIDAMDFSALTAFAEEFTKNFFE